jgi:hypothetical protein
MDCILSKRSMRRRTQKELCLRFLHTKYPKPDKRAHGLLKGRATEEHVVEPVINNACRVLTIITSVNMMKLKVTHTAEIVNQNKKNV